MQTKQKQVWESFFRVRAILAAHPPSGSQAFGVAMRVFDAVLARLREHGATQSSALALRRAESARLEQLIRRLRDRHMRPIVTTARAELDAGSDVRLPEALRMPATKLGVTRMLQASDGMIEAATPFSATLIARGLPVDFLQRFRLARNELELSAARHATLHGAYLAAGKGLQVELRRGRLEVDRLDALLRASFEGDEAVLAAWRAAKRVHRLPVRNGADGEEVVGEIVGEPAPGAVSAREWGAPPVLELLRAA
jgi:hypothetical protein